MPSAYERVMQSIAAMDTGDSYMLADGRGGFWACDYDSDEVYPITLGVFCKVLGAKFIDVKDLPNVLRLKVTSNLN